MKFCWVTLTVNDMEQSLKFYRDLLGLKVCAQFSAGDGTRIAMLGEADKPKVELICHEGGAAASRGTGVTVGFETEESGDASLEKAMERLQGSGFPVVRGPFAPTPQTRFFFIKDPNGIEVQIVENRRG